MPDRQKLKSDAAELAEKAKQAGEPQLETGKQMAAEQTEKVAGVVEQASAQFRESELPSLSDCARQLGSSIKSFCEDLRNKSVDDLLKDVDAILQFSYSAVLQSALPLHDSLKCPLRTSISAAGSD